MSEENVEIVRRALAAYSGTGEPPEALLDPEIRVWESPELPGELSGKGYDNLVRANEYLLDSFEEWSIEPERFFDLGERILVFVMFRVKGKGSGAVVDAPLACLCTLRQGKVIEWGLFGDRDEALEAAGLSE
jgi:ketosteroid isomerase-like protein